MPSAWITNVKQYAKTHNISYKDALQKHHQHIKKLNNFLNIYINYFSLKKI